MIASVGFLVGAAGAAAAPGDVDPGFKPSVARSTIIATEQADGKIVLTTSSVVRLFPDGTPDPAFVPDPLPGNPLPTAIQADGRIILGFSIADGLVRLLPDGRVDSDFHPEIRGTVASVTIQPDGKLVIGSGIIRVNGVDRVGVTRLHPDGTLDTTFLAKVNTGVLGTATQPDGMIVIVGGFTKVNDVTRNYIARLHPDGSLDVGFNPNAGSSVYSVTVLPDGKILVGGGSVAIGSIGGVPRGDIARLHPNGTLDTAFYPTTNNPGGHSVRWVPQTDGKLIIAGAFTTVNGTPRNRIARLHQNGTLDMDFNPNANSYIQHVMIQADGKVIITGADLTAVGGVPRNYIARLENDSATQSLTVPDSTRVRWLRGGASPEVREVKFDLSTDGGSTWSPLGFGTRIAGGWELYDLTLPGRGLLRAGARTLVGQYWGGSGIVETVTAFPPPSENAFRITDAVLQGSNVLVSFNSKTGLSYTLWQSDTMAEGTWTDTGLPALTGTGQPLTFTFPVAA